MSSQSQKDTISQSHIRLLYRVALYALITSISMTPVALMVSYEYSKTRYDRIVDHQVSDFQKQLFSKIGAGADRRVIQNELVEYLADKEGKPSEEAHLEYILLTDEFDQDVAEAMGKNGRNRGFSKISTTSCVQSFFPIITFGEQKYFCSKSAIANGHSHYNLYGILIVSDDVISDFIGNAVLICAFTSFVVIIVSIVQYYVSLRVSQTLIKANVKTLLLLGNAVALRDNDTFHHNLRVVIYSYHFGNMVNLPENTMNDLISGALLHDIGKIGIPDAILQKPGKLTSQEFDVIKGHVVLGEQIMLNSEWVGSGIDVIKYHHEKYDGYGYPYKLSGNDIPIIARIFAIVDVFDALTSERPYKDAKTYEDTMVVLMSSKGSHFDAELVDSSLIYLVCCMRIMPIEMTI